MNKETTGSTTPASLGFKEPDSRIAPLGGEYVARIANTTAVDDQRINVGYTSTGLKGAGIRQYEYASAETISSCRLQLEALFWCAVDAKEQMIIAGMDEHHIYERSKAITDKAATLGLFDKYRLIERRVINSDKELVCPLCLEPISANGFLNRLPQATGRNDMT